MKTLATFALLALLALPATAQNSSDRRRPQGGSGCGSTPGGAGCGSVLGGARLVIPSGTTRRPYIPEAHGGSDQVGVGGVVFEIDGGNGAVLPAAPRRPSTRERLDTMIEDLKDRGMWPPHRKAIESKWKIADLKSRRDEVDGQIANSQQAVDFLKVLQDENARRSILPSLPQKVASEVATNELVKRVVPKAGPLVTVAGLVIDAAEAGYKKLVKSETEGELREDFLRANKHVIGLCEESIKLSGQIDAEQARLDELEQKKKAYEKLGLEHTQEELRKRDQKQQAQKAPQQGRATRHANTTRVTDAAGDAEERKLFEERKGK